VIPRDYVTEWRAQAPWVQDFQVEQDLVISRALVEIFSHPLLHEALAFRGGTALYKLHLRPAARYSEDIDLVQTKAEPAGPMMEALRGRLDPWLGKPRWKQTKGRVTFVYRFDSEDAPPVPLEAEGRDEHAGAFRGLRSQASAVRGVLRMVPRARAGFTATNSTSSSERSCERSTSASRAAICSTWRRRWRTPTLTLPGSSRRFLRT
jgi:hypothetical protein